MAETAAPNAALSAAPSAVQVQAAAFQFSARYAAPDVAHAVRISVQREAPRAVEPAEFPMVSRDAVLVVRFHDLVPESPLSLEFPDAVAPQAVPLSAPVDSRAVQATCVESSEFVDLSRVALRPPAFSVVLLAEAFQFAVLDVR